jgi:pyruvate formate lyase activating enzyme
VVIINVNFGGFVPLSTIDWRGRSVCTLFLRGCPIRCSYCQNEAIQAGEDYRDSDEIIAMIAESAPYISGVVFSGGEPALQKDALIELAKRSKGLGLAVGLQTNGLFPDTLDALIAGQLVDRIALDYKTQWEGFSGAACGPGTVPGENYQKSVRRSIALCKKAYREGSLLEFEVVVTVFYENADYIRKISESIGTIPLVLQQGEHKIGKANRTAPDITHGEYIYTKRNLQANHPPLTLGEIKEIADGLGRTVRIRTREIGEISYESDWRRRAARKRQR